MGEIRRFDSCIVCRSVEVSLTQKNGRSGQKQHGVDVYGTPQATPGINFGVQCKGKNEGYGAKATIVEFDTELIKAENFKPQLGHWTFATTAPNDARLQEHARLVSEQRVKEGKFPVVAIGWDTIQALLSTHQEVIEEIYPEHASDLHKIMAALRALPSSRSSIRSGGASLCSHQDHQYSILKHQFGLRLSSKSLVILDLL